MTLLAELFGPYRDDVQAMAAADPAFAGYLLTAEPTGHHIIGFAIAAANARPADRPPIGELAAALRGWHRPRLVSWLVDQPPAELAKVLGRLTGRPWEPHAYLDLINLIRDPSAAAVLRHLPAISPLAIETMRAISPAYWRPAVIQAVITEADLQALRLGLAVIERARGDLDRNEICRSIDRCLKRHAPPGHDDDPDPDDELSEILAGWVEQQLIQKGIPQPPWGGNQTIKPLATIKEIGEVGRRFEICMAGHVTDVVAGKSFAYTASEPIAAVIWLEHLPLFGWAVGEISGPRYKPVPSRARREIEDAFVEAGFLPSLNGEGTSLEFLLR